MAISNIFIGDVCSNDYCIFPTNAGIYETPKRSIDFVEIDGRNGDLTIDNERFENVKITYPCAVYENFSVNHAAFRSKLLRAKGYQRITDTFEPDRYRMGILTDISSLSYSMDAKIGTFEMEFNCMPQWWLKSGDDVITLTGNGVLFNPTDYLAKPLIRVYGHGKIYIGSHEITVNTAGNEFIDIDCQSMDADEGGINRNSNILVESWLDLGLDSGENGIKLDSTITKLEITPRWYTI